MSFGWFVLPPRFGVEVSRIEEIHDQRGLSRLTMWESLHSHGSGLQEGWDDPDGELDPPTVIPDKGNANTVAKELATRDCDGLDRDKTAPEARWSKFTNVDRCDGRGGPDSESEDDTADDDLWHRE